MDKVCIICHKETKKGIPIKEDFVIKSIRKVKRALRISTGNTLIVCEEHVGDAKKRREKFEKSLLTYVGLGAVIGIVLILISIFQSKSLSNILVSFGLLVLLVLLMAAFSLYQYFPSLMKKPEKKVKRSRKVKR